MVNDTRWFNSLLKHAHTHNNSTRTITSTIRKITLVQSTRWASGFNLLFDLVWFLFVCQRVVCYWLLFRYDGISCRLVFMCSSSLTTAAAKITTKTTRRFLQICGWDDISQTKLYPPIQHQIFQYSYWTNLSMICITIGDCLSCEYSTRQESENGMACRCERLKFKIGTFQFDGAAYLLLLLLLFDWLIDQLFMLNVVISRGEFNFHVQMYTCSNYQWSLIAVIFLLYVTGTTAQQMRIFNQ